jgi:hypothetical protein
MRNKVAYSNQENTNVVATPSGQSHEWELTLNLSSKSVKVSSEKPPIDNGDKAVWKITMWENDVKIPNRGIVTIDFDGTLATDSFSSSAGGSEVGGDVLEEIKSIPVSVIYSVYHTDNGTKTLLEWDSATPSPCLVIDRIGEPPPCRDPKGRWGYHQNMQSPK